MATNNTKKRRQAMLEISKISLANPSLFVNVPPLTQEIREQFLKEMLNLLNAECDKSNKR